MKTTYIAGDYILKVKGRGMLKLKLTKAQAKAMFEIQRQLSHEWEEFGLAEYISF